LKKQGERDATLRFAAFLLEVAHDVTLFIAGLRTCDYTSVEAARCGTLMRNSFAFRKSNYGPIAMLQTMDYGPRKGPLDEDGNSTYAGR
jgi:hypothetical protein